MDSNAKAKKFIKLLTICTVCILFATAFIVILFDPFYHYHAPLPGMKAVLEERDYEVIGTIDHFDYDAVLLGDSLVENTNTAILAEYFDVTAIKAIRAGGSNADILFYLDRAYEKQDLKKVFYCIDKAALVADTKVTFPENDYYYLVDKNPINDWKYLWNKDVLLKKIPLQLAYNTVLDYNENEAYAWYSTKTFSKDAMLTHYVPDTVFNDPQPVPETFYENLALLKAEITSHPETEFYLFYPPVSMLWWDSELRAGCLDADLELLKELSSAFADCPNARLYGFYNADEYTQLDKYMDVVHFSPEVNQAMYEDMKDGLYLMNADTVDEDLEQLREKVLAFSSEEITEYYPDIPAYTP